ncbi:zinc finger domain-containing protein [Gordonia liuliyuniae]|uniref:zinc finger domain-containing protein n=1 Tax=Gordonia liuliyuniae TaxID=2911517 RepID=UPI0027E11AC7|nr:zinc finger domain-containing protein [Gordonia liuliyuniae]
MLSAMSSTPTSRRSPRRCGTTSPRTDPTQNVHTCPRCEALVARETFMNRSSHFCPVCQRRR